MGDLEKVSVTGNSEQEGNWVADVPDNQLKSKRGVIDIQVSTPPSEEAVDESHERNDTQQGSGDHRSDLETEPRTA